MLDLEIQGQRPSTQYCRIFFKFPDMDLVDIDTKVTFLSHLHRDILNNVQGSKMTPSGPSR